MRKRTESLTATKTTVNQTCIQPSHYYYASCIGKQVSKRLSENYAKGGGENGVISDST